MKFIMINQELRKYITEQRSCSQSDEQITATLLLKGWGSSEIDDAFSEINTAVYSEMHPSLTIFQKNSHYKCRPIFVYAIAIIILAAGIGLTYAYKNHLDKSALRSVMPIPTAGGAISALNTSIMPTPTSFGGVDLLRGESESHSELQLLLLNTIDNKVRVSVSSTKNSSCQTQILSFPGNTIFVCGSDYYIFAVSRRTTDDQGVSIEITKSASTPTPNTTVQQQDAKLLSYAYTLSSPNFTFDYPNSWTIVARENTKDNTVSFTENNATFTFLTTPRTSLIPPLSQADLSVLNQNGNVYNVSRLNINGHSAQKSVAYSTTPDGKYYGSYESSTEFLGKGGTVITELQIKFTGAGVPLSSFQSYIDEYDARVISIRF